ncbi:MAG: DUF4340 domain-containing protein [Acidobacteriota bacterium]
MKPRTLAFLTILTLGLGLFIFFVERDLPSTDERREREKKVLGLDAEDIIGLTLEGGDRSVSFLKDPGEGDDLDGGDWRLVSPLSARADGAKITGLVERLVALESERTLETVDPAQLGIDAPRARAALTTASGERTLLIGADLPFGDGVVVQSDDPTRAFQVKGAGDLVAEFSRDVDEWRDLSLFLAERADIAAVTLIAGADRVRLERRGDGEVFLLKGDAGEAADDIADGQSVSGLLTGLTGLKASRFLNAEVGTPESQPARGLEPAEQVIEVDLAGDDNPWRLELGAVVAGDSVTFGGTGRYARAGGQLVVLNAPALEGPLTKTAEAWRSRAWASMQVFAVERARFQLDRAVEVRRESGDWIRTVDGDDVKVDYTAASDALYPLTEARAVDVLSRAEAVEQGHTLEGPRLEITLADADGEEERLRLYPTAADGLAAATVDGREVVLLLAGDDADGAVSHAEALRDAPPWIPSDDEPTAEAGDHDHDGHDHDHGGHDHDH